MANEQAIIDGLERNLKNLRTEERNYDEQVQNLSFINKLIAKEIDINKEMVEVLADTKRNKRLEPKFQFENDADFLKLQAQLDRLGVEKKMHELRLNIDRNEHVISNAAEELKRIRAEIPRAEESLRKAKGE
jgi:hypothetical protein